MQEAVKGFVKKTNEKSGLFLLDMPTGSGKTYNTLQLIKQFLEEESLQEVKRIFYITPTNKNVLSAYEQLKSMLSSELFEANVLLLQANDTSIIDNFQNVKKDIMSSKISNAKEVKKMIDYINILNNPGENSTKALIKQQFSQEIEPAFRQFIKSTINKDAKNEIYRYRNVTHLYPWLCQLYPSILINERKVFFLSVSKFINIIDPIIRPPFQLINSDYIKDSLVFIDEVDSAKEFILRSQIEESTKYAINVVKLISSISTNLASDKEFPAKNFVKFNDLELQKKSEVTFNKFKKVILDTRSATNLNYSFKLESLDTNDKAIIFSDYSTSTIFGKDNSKDLFVKVDEEQKINVITSQSTDKNSHRFSKVISTLTGAFTYSRNFFAISSRNYLTDYNNNKKDSDDKIEPEQAIATMLAPFDLDKTLQDCFIKCIMEDYSLASLSKKSKSLFNVDFYMDGFRYFDFVDDLSHDTITYIEMNYLKETPEKFMFKLASKTRVIGLSATATIPSAIGNFNLDYLKGKLGKNYYTLDEVDFLRLKRDWDKKQNEIEYPINVESIETEALTSEELAGQIFETNDYIDNLAHILNKSEKYDKQRFTKVLKAIKLFVQDSKGKVLLVLTNNNIREDDSNPFNKNNIQNIVDNIAKESNIQKEFSIHCLVSSRFEKEKNDYLEDIKNGKTVILFTSYPSASTGQNLQYTISTEQDNEIVKKEQDIDSIYLERPTNILVKISSDQALIKEDLCKYIYQIECLKEIGELSISDANILIKRAFEHFLNKNCRSSNVLKKSYSTNSVLNHMITILIQSIGRICRTRNQGKDHSNIYLDSEILEKLDFSCMENRLMNKEFAGIIAKSNSKKEKQNTIDETLNIGAVQCQKLHCALNRLLNNNKKGWTENYVTEWKDYRDLLLQKPTVSSKLSSLFFAPFQKGKKGKQLYFSKYDDGNISNINLSYQKTEKCPNEISEQDCHLPLIMKIPFIREYFQSKKYAISWKEGTQIMNPVAYKNIYKGALGEQVGFAILNHFKIKLCEIDDPDKFEKFDFCLEEDKDIYIDFKFWEETFSKNQEQEREKILKKLESIQGKKIFVVNIFSKPNWKPHDTGKIYECPRLLKELQDGNFEIDEYQIKELFKKITEAVNNGNNK